MTIAADFPYRFTWAAAPCKERKGQRCKIVKKSGHFTATVVVQFEDGAQHEVPRAALKQAR